MPSTKPPPLPAQAAAAPQPGRLFYRISVGPSKELERLLAQGYKFLKIEPPRPQ